MLDLVLAIAHHLLIFGIFGILFVEFMTVRPGLGIPAVLRIASIDRWYGALAGAVLVVGFCRAIFAAKGWTYYSHNAFFWAKIATFLLTSLVSVPPTIDFMRWRKSGLVPDDAAVFVARRYLHIELALFVLLPIFAAAMARGFGEF